MGRCKLRGPSIVQTLSDREQEGEESEEEEEDSEEESEEEESAEEEESEEEEEEELGQTTFKRCTRHLNCPKPAGHRGACKTRAPAQLSNGANLARFKAVSLASEEAGAAARRVAEVIAEAVWSWHPRVDCIGAGEDGVGFCDTGGETDRTERRRRRTEKERGAESICSPSPNTALDSTIGSSTGQQALVLSPTWEAKTQVQVQIPRWRLRCREMLRKERQGDEACRRGHCER